MPFLHYVPLLLFFIDYGASILLDASIVLSLVDYYIVCLFTKQNPLAAIPFIALTSFLWFQTTNISLAACLPITLGAFLCAKWLKPTVLTPSTLLLLYIFTQNLLIYLILGNQTPLKSYTIWQFCVNVGIILSMSLISYVAGKQDNRL